MSERMKKVIAGAVSGAGTVIVMEILRGSSYMGGASVLAKAALAGIIAGVIYVIIRAIVKLARHG
ncbi:MAG: hypothetical protein Q8O90_07725 [Elusimicrobiota bacterium]|nr:hypothetical protein [Elusimicrobiota bacterium]